MSHLGAGDPEPSGPDPESLTRYITDTFPGVYVIAASGSTFFSLDEKHFPNFATIVTSDDDFDEGSKLSRPGVFRLNIGVGRETFERLVDPSLDPDYAALDTVLPHPTYASQRWVSILNPTAETFDAVVRPLLQEAHDRLAAQRARHARPG